MKILPKAQQAQTYYISSLVLLVHARRPELVPLVQCGQLCWNIMVYIGWELVVGS